LQAEALCQFGLETLDGKVSRQAQVGCHTAEAVVLCKRASDHKKNAANKLGGTKQVIISLIKPEVRTSVSERPVICASWSSE